MGSFLHDLGIDLSLFRDLRVLFLELILPLSNELLLSSFLIVLYILLELPLKDVVLVLVPLDLLDHLQLPLVLLLGSCQLSFPLESLFLLLECLLMTLLSQSFLFHLLLFLLDPIFFL